MPPAPIVRVELRMDEYDRLCTNLGLMGNMPHVNIITKTTKEELSGTWNAANNTTTIYAGLHGYERGRLLHAARELTRVVLHETRHAWQYKTYGQKWWLSDDKLPYRHRKKEIDAREFEDANVAGYMLVTVSRKFPSSSMSRLASVERKVRKV